jgi:putative transposase
MCRFFKVSASGYHKWLISPPSKRAMEEKRLELEIEAAHNRTRQTFGAERLQRDLALHGVKIGICRIRRIRKKLGIRCKQIKRFKATTNSRHTYPVAENLLQQRFQTAAPKQVWVSDLTYIPPKEGWLYCAAHKDLFTGEIVGYALGSGITMELVKQSLLRAVAVKKSGEGLIHHSDRGSQYCAHKYQRLLHRLGIKASMSRKGNCYDNSPIESFWGIMKSELVHHRKYQTRDEAIKDISEYIEVFYNRQRYQKRLGYLSPVLYERQFYVQRAAT